MGLAQRAHQQVELLHVGRVLAVHLLQARQVAGLAGQVLEPGDGRQAQLTTKLVVARHAAFAGAHDVDRGHVEERVAGDRQLLQEAREVVQHQLPRVLVAEAVEQIGHGPARGDSRRARLPRAHEVQLLGRLGTGRVGVAAQVQLLGQQRMQPVDLGELFRQPEAAAVLVDRVAHHATQLGVDHLHGRQGLARLAVAVREVADQPVPVGVHAVVQRRVGQDGRRPFDGVDLGHHRGVDQPRHVEQPVVVPLGVGRRQVRADGVVLAREQRVQHRQAHPPVADEPGVLHAVVGHGQAAVGLQPQAAAGVLAQAVLRGLVAAVQLRAVPPVRHLVDGAAGGGLFPRRARGVGLAAADEHLGLPVARARRVAVGQRHLDGLEVVDLAVVDPVMVHELDPAGRQQVEERHFLHPRLAVGTRRAAQQHAADDARVGRHQLLARLGPDGGQRHVAQEARARGAFHRVGQVVPAAVGGAEVRHAHRRHLPLGLKAHQHVGRVAAAQVARVQPLAHVGQRQDGQPLGAVVPVGPDGVPPAHQPAHRVHRRLGQRRADVAQQRAQPVAPAAQPARPRGRWQRHRQRAVGDDRRRQQRLALEVVQVGHEAVHARLGIALAQLLHGQPVGASRVVGRGTRQRGGVVTRGGVVVLVPEAGQRQQRGGVGALRRAAFSHLAGARAGLGGLRGSLVGCFGGHGVGRHALEQLARRLEVAPRDGLQRGIDRGVPGGGGFRRPGGRHGGAHLGVLPSGLPGGAVIRRRVAAIRSRRP